MVAFTSSPNLGLPICERRLYHYTYPTLTKSGQPLKPHQTRDGDAALAIGSIFFARGFQYGGVIPNFPSRQGFGNVAIDGVEDALGLTARDVILITTRLPMDDDEEKDRRLIRRSGTKAEKWVLHCMRRAFLHCSKKRVDVAGTDSKWASLKFDTRYPSDIKGRPGTTAAYLVCMQPKLPDGSRGPRIVCAFGMCGTTTLLWADWIARMNPDLLLHDGVTVARVTAPPQDSIRTALYQHLHAYADLWSFDIACQV